jgi:hypothetical protein
MNVMFRFVILLLLFSFAVPAAEEELVFSGLPSVRFDVDGKEAVRVDLSEQGSHKYVCRITGKGKRFFWASRGSRELIRYDAGGFTYYVSPEGSGFIKVAAVKGTDYDYMESFTAEMKTITYWGKREK